MIFEQFIQKVASEDDRSAIRQLLEKFDQEKRKGTKGANRDVLNNLSNEALKYEMRYLPRLHEDKDFLKQLDAEKRALLILVGNRKNPILITLSIIKPRFVVLIHTKESENTVEEIKKILANDQSFPATKFKCLQIDPLQIPQTYQQLADLLKEHEKERFDWVCDITGGKKVMGASLAAFGFWRRIPTVYLESQEFMGTAEPFSEELNLIANPYDCYGDPLLAMAQTACEDFNFASAIAALNSLLKTTVLQQQHHKAEWALKVVNLYHQWDHFRHSDPDAKNAEEFFADFEKTFETLVRLGHQFIERTQMEKNAQFVAKLKETYQERKVSLVDGYRLADIFQNAQRRAHQMNFDDAVARLYRCVEMAATYLLAQLEPDFKPDKADWEKLKQKYPNIEQLYIQKAKITFPGDKNESLPKFNKIGLGVQITLAAALAECISANADRNDSKQSAIIAAGKIFKIYCDNDNSDGPFAQRNRSILAHGTRTVSKDVFEKFKKVAFEICRLAVGQEEWRQNYQMAEFPNKFHLVDDNLLLARK